MRRLDTLVLRELAGPWAFGVAMFTTLLIAATYLGRIAEYIVQGIPPATVGQILLLLLPAILVKTFAMSTLLAGLLGLGRLSGDSEVIAIRAAGASLWRILLPVTAFALAVAALSFALNETLVPGAAKRSEALARDLAGKIDLKGAQPISQPQIEDGRLRLMVAARGFSLAEGTLQGVTLIVYDEGEQPQYVLVAPTLRWRGREDWRIEGGAKITSLDGGTVVRVNEAWPTGTPTLKASPQDLAGARVNDPDFLSMRELGTQIARARADRTLPEKGILNREFWYWNKMALPLATFVFGLLGASLGIRNARSAPAAGFALAIAIIFGYFMLTNFLAVWAQGGVMPPWL
ncbi:MAG: hypothetical protein C4320_08905, partial [Armatimonadota bacterium]